MAIVLSSRLMISAVVLSLSVQATVPVQGWLVKEGKAYWYEKSTRQGTLEDPKGVLGEGTVRGREIYDPESDGWYWLDACYEGAKATEKEVWMPYIYQDEASWDEKTLREAAELSGTLSGQVY